MAARMLFGLHVRSRVQVRKPYSASAVGLLAGGYFARPCLLRAAAKGTLGDACVRFYPELDQHALQFLLGAVIAL